MKRAKIRGGEFEDFLKEEGILAEVDAVAIKRALAIQIACQMKKKALNKSILARRMKTSRAALDRLLDPATPSVTLDTLSRVATALGMHLKIDLVA